MQVHVYGLEEDSWSETGSTFASLAQLKKNVTPGNQIANNVVEDSRNKTKFLGQIWANSTTASERQLDVTDFVRSQTDLVASFLIVQEYRWSASNQLGSGVGDTQPDGVNIASRSSTSALRPALKFYP